MNHAHEIMDLLEHRGVYRGQRLFNTYGAMRDVDHEEFAKVMYGSFANSMCFYMDPPDWPEVRSPEYLDEDLIKLPYDFCWFETITAKRRPAGILVCWERHDDISTFRMITFIRDYLKNWQLISSSSLNTKDWRTLYVDPPIQEAQGKTNALVSHVLRFLSIYNCSNIEVQENEPDPKLQKKRAKKSKRPLFSFWTLKLTNKRYNNEPQGGSHASPRLHLRRGHVRQYMPGKYCWVNAHAVGRKELGIVHKDYDGRKNDD